MESDTHIITKSIRITDNNSESYCEGKLICNNDIDAKDINCNNIIFNNGKTNYLTVNDNITANNININNATTKNITTNNISTNNINSKNISYNILCVIPQIVTIVSSCIIDIEKSIILIYAKGEGTVNINNKYNNSIVRIILTYQMNKTNIIVINIGLIKYKLRNVNDYIELLYHNDDYIYIGGNITF